MAVTSRLYPAFIKSLLNKEADFDTDTLKAMLVTSSYAFDATITGGSTLRPPSVRTLTITTDVRTLTITTPTRTLTIVEDP